MSNPHPSNSGKLTAKHVLLRCGERVMNVIFMYKCYLFCL